MYKVCFDDSMALSYELLSKNIFWKFVKILWVCASRRILILYMRSKLVINAAVHSMSMIDILLVIKFIFSV